MDLTFVSDQRHVAVESETPVESETRERTAAQVSDLGTVLSESLQSAGRVFKVSGAAVALGVVLALCWAGYHRHDIQLLPFEGTDGAASALRLSRALDAVALGSTSYLEVDPSLHFGGADGPPTISIPGTSISFASLVNLVQHGPLAQTKIRGALVDHDKTYQVWLQVSGPSIGNYSIR